jgi:hypothetical protein
MEDHFEEDHYTDYNVLSETVVWPFNTYKNFVLKLPRGHEWTRFFAQLQNDIFFVHTDVCTWRELPRFIQKEIHPPVIIEFLDTTPDRLGEMYTQVPDYFGPFRVLENPFRNPKVLENRKENNKKYFFDVNELCK